MIPADIHLILLLKQTSTAFSCYSGDTLATWTLKFEKKEEVININLHFPSKQQILLLRDRSAHSAHSGLFYHRMRPNYILIRLCFILLYFQQNVLLGRGKPSLSHQILETTRSMVRMLEELVLARLNLRHSLPWKLLGKIRRRSVVSAHWFQMEDIWGSLAIQTYLVFKFQRKLVMYRRSTWILYKLKKQPTWAAALCQLRVSGKIALCVGASDAMNSLNVKKKNLLFMRQLRDRRSYVLISSQNRMN